MRRYWWLAVGVVLFVGGLAVVTATHTWGGHRFGWFAYSPLSQTGPSLGQQFSHDVRDFWTGIALSVVGAIVIASGVGYRIGQRNSPPEHPE